VLGFLFRPSHRQEAVDPRAERPGDYPERHVATSPVRIVGNVLDSARVDGVGFALVVDELPTDDVGDEAAHHG
jgi:hypothetical protein